MVEGHFNIKRASILDGEGRLKELRPYHLLRDVASITQGMTCIDLGCGTGAFSFPMVLCVGDEGVVYAVDDSAGMLGYIRAKNPPPNMRLVHRDASQTGLANQIADFCLLAFILHEVKQPDSFIVEAFRLLKPGGRALVVEWKADRDSPGPPRSRRLTMEHIERLFQQGGFSCFEYTNWSNNHYLATGRKILPG